MIRMECDYSEGAHPWILQRLLDTNLEQSPGYGTDGYCDRARELIRSACHAPQAAVEFLVGGTQANATVIAASLRPYQGAVCADTGHIHVHETGAVEAAGHKILPLPSLDGKLLPQDLEQLCAAHFADPSREHMVQPGMVYLSHPTECGTLYTRQELEEIRKVCDRWSLPLFIDGARCGYGLAAEGADVDLPDLARLAHVFTIGGTKVGALFGEAVVMPDPGLLPDFRYMIKRHGGMLAKGRLLGIQFETLFEDDLYRQLGRHAVELAGQIRAALQRQGIPQRFPTTANQIFAVFTPEQRARLEESFLFSFWEGLPDGRVVLRICTSWATSAGDVDALCAALAEL